MPIRAWTCGGLLALAVPACVATEPVSIWPPPDYYVEVRYQENGLDRQRVRFWADGTALYTEAEQWLGGPDADTASFPVFTKVSAYEMRGKSIRDLSRLLERAGLLDMQAEYVGDLEDTSRMVTIHWRAFEQAGTVWMGGRAEGPTVRVLQVINSFLPPGCEFMLDGVSGDPEPPHLVEVPAPADSLPGALDFYREKLLGRDPLPLDLLVEAFALAVRAGQRELAEELLRRIEAGSVESQDDWWVFPGGERSSLAAQLRVLLEREGPPADPPGRDAR